MEPIEFPEVNKRFAEKQDEYRTLPVHLDDTVSHFPAISCWELSFGERMKLLFTGKLWFSQWTYGNDLQPQLPTVNKWELLNKEYWKAKHKEAKKN